MRGFIKSTLGGGILALLLLAALPLQAQQAAPGAQPGGQQGQEQQQGGEEDENDQEAAREALMQQEDDPDDEERLEEVFQAAEERYSLLESGGMGLTFNGSYNFTRSDRIDINIDDDGNINRFRIENDAQHAFNTSLSFDYGIWDNLTFNTRLPVSYKFDTERDTQQAALGDVSLGLRYQPIPVRPGGLNTTLYTTLTTATGDSPFEIDPSRDVSSGSGYYSLGGGVSMSRVLDPTVLFGSIGYTHNFNATNLDQRRGENRTLTEVDPGDTVNFSMGLAYSLSYEVSLSASYQQSYNFATRFEFEDGDVAESQEATSSIVNMSLGLRTARNRIVNLGFGFGLTADSPDVLLSISMPIDISGLRGETDDDDMIPGGTGGGGGAAGP